MKNSIGHTQTHRSWIGPIALAPRFRRTRGGQYIARAIRKRPTARRTAIGNSLKRSTDIALASGAVVAMSPLLLGLGLLMKAQMPGPILYGHERVGHRGRRFRCWKLRTMHQDGDAILERHLASDPAARAEWEETRKLTDDPRVTPLGRVLRELSLDELPQFLNVIAGDMSLVGPRPVVADELERYGSSRRHYLSLRPGVTGLWQVSGRNETCYSRRVALDRYYASRWSPALDAAILARTVPAVVAKRGAR
jgi:exopolysaccharide production protein ExoY